MVPNFGVQNAKQRLTSAKVAHHRHRPFSNVSLKPTQGDPGKTSVENSTVSGSTAFSGLAWGNF